ncbi:MAG: S-layer homology domain-containing protein [Clostridia bacterium]|nr:S-layer homology domain-containing protein [Clostridia bacterium]
MRKKVFSMALAVMMIITLMPTPVFAADPPVIVTITNHVAGSLETEINNYITANSISTYSAVTVLNVSGGTINNVDRVFFYDQGMAAELEEVDFSATSFDYSGPVSGHFPADNPNELPEYAFGNWTSLKSLSLPDSITFIDNWAFNNCPKLEVIYLPAGLNEIGHSVFNNSSELATVYSSSPTPPASFHPNAFLNVAADAVLYVPAGAGSAWDEKDKFPDASNDGKLYQLKIENMAPILSLWADRISDAEAIVEVYSNEPGQCYYALVEDGDAEPVIETSDPGVAFDSYLSFTVTFGALNAGAYDFYVKAKDSLGNIGDSQRIDIGVYVPPAVISKVEPSGSDAEKSGNVVITFSQKMDTGHNGKVSLDGGATFLTGGAWSVDEVTYTIPYSGLASETTYSIAISEFYDAIWNKVADNSSNSFTTKKASSGGHSSTSSSSDTKKVTEEETPGTVAFFGDVKESDWFYGNVKFVQEKGLMNGGEDGNFKPGGNMTRAMIVTVLYRLSGENSTYGAIFSDVASNAWYGNASAWAAANGISNGVGNNRFAPDLTLTREQLAGLLYNYAKLKGIDLTPANSDILNQYTDVGSISAWASDSMVWAVNAGIISGDGAMLNPKGTATRAQVAAMLQRFSENIIK